MRAAFRRRKAAAPGAPAPAKKPRKPARTFDVAAALAFVDARLAEPPPPAKKLKAGRERPAVQRVDGVGSLVLRCVLPLEDAPTANRLIELARIGAVVAMSRPGRKPAAQQAAAIGSQFLEKLKKRVLSRMLLQARRRAEPLPGRAMVRMIRFTHTAQDYDTSWTKIPLDRLQVGKRERSTQCTDGWWIPIGQQMGPVELGYIRGDSRHEIDLHAWSEPAPPGKGCVLVEVWTGRAG